jgi:hypothetical protein
MTKDLFEKVAIGIVSAILGLAGSMVGDRVKVENRETAAAVQIEAVNQRLIGLETDLREIRRILMDKRGTGQ